MSANVAEKSVSTGLDMVKGIVITAIPVIGGLVLYNLFLANSVKKLHDKMFPKA